MVRAEMNEVGEFRSRSVLAVCCAGSDRSRYIAEELNNRGYFATGAEVMYGQNYVTPEDLQNIGVIVFSSVHEKKIFDANSRLAAMVKRNGIEVRVLNITESDKDLAHNCGKLTELKENIARQLDCVGLTDLGSRGLRRK
jgi:hypothetical protein